MTATAPHPATPPPPGPRAAEEEVRALTTGKAALSWTELRVSRERAQPFLRRSPRSSAQPAPCARGGERRARSFWCPGRAFCHRRQTPVARPSPGRPPTPSTNTPKPRRLSPHCHKPERSQAGQRDGREARSVALEHVNPPSHPHRRTTPAAGRGGTGMSRRVGGQPQLPADTPLSAAAVQLTGSRWRR